LLTPLHSPRLGDFAITMTDEENAVFAEHFRRFQQMLADGVIILVEPTLGRVNTGVAVFEAPTRQQRRRS
jgi:hypothetical protein